MNTNRELYKALEQLLKEKAEQPNPSLEHYLLNLIRHAGAYARQDSIKLQDFFCVLRDAFEGPGALTETAPSNATPGFWKWRKQIEEQMKDLRDMEGSKQPSGRYWFNFDPCNYIECGMAGSLGGWSDGDETDRHYVRGPVACLGHDGSITSSDPRDLDSPPTQVPEVTWELFSDFAWCGQNYE